MIGLEDWFEDFGIQRSQPDWTDRETNNPNKSAVIPKI